MVVILYGCEKFSPHELAFGKLGPKVYFLSRGIRARPIPVLGLPNVRPHAMFWC